MDRERATRLRLRLLTLGVGDSLLLPLFSFSGVDVNGSKRLFPTPSVGNLSLMQAVSLSFNGNVEFKPRFCRWLQTGKIAEICDL